MVERKRAGGRKVKVADERKMASESSRELEPIRPYDEEEGERITREFSEGRKNVGARNPYIIGLRVLAQRGEDVSSYTPHDLPEIMSRAFPDYDYNQLFDPRHGSPVYFGIYNATLKLAEVCPKLYGESLVYLKKDPERRVGAIPRICDPEEEGHLIRAPSRSKTIHGHNFEYRKILGSPTRGLEFHNPVQGCLADCWLISALSSVAWAETNGKVPKKLAAATEITLFSPNERYQPRKITTSMDFYLDTTSDRPYYATSDEDEYTLGFYESWPCFYEKCFASYWQQDRVAKDTSYNPPRFFTNNSPDYSYLNFKDPIGATKEMTNFPVVSHTTASYQPNNENKIVDDIFNNACVTGTALNNGIFVRANKAVTAYTYLTAARANDPDVVYDEDGLPANHAFSILGVYMENNTKFVVLRNPWGFGGGPASFNLYSQSHLAQNLPRVDSLPGGISQADQASKGIFGLDSLCFKKYFEVFGWVG